MSQHRPLLLAALIALGAAGARAQEAAPPAATAGRITVVGRGAVEVAPERAVVALSVSARAPSAAAALDATSAAAGRLLELARGAGIDPRDVGTEAVTLGPVMKSVRDAQGNFTQVPDGYAARNAIEVRVPVTGGDTARLGRFLRAAAGEGATGIEGLRFEPADPAKALEDAGAAAVEDALRRARRMAAAAGARLGPVERVGPPRAGGEPPAMLEMARTRAAAPAPVPVAAGSLGVGAVVEVTWQLLPAAP